MTNDQIIFPKKQVESLWLFSQAHVVRTPSEFPVGSHEQLNAAPWLKAQSLTVAVFFFFLLEELLCFGQGVLSSATPPWPFFMPYWPWSLWIAALEMPLAHSAIFEDVLILSCQMTQVIAWQLCVRHESGRELHCMPFTWLAERLMAATFVLHTALRPVLESLAEKVLNSRKQKHGNRDHCRERDIFLSRVMLWKTWSFEHLSLLSGQTQAFSSVLVLLCLWEVVVFKGALQGEESRLCPLSLVAELFITGLLYHMARKIIGVWNKSNRSFIQIEVWWRVKM